MWLVDEKQDEQGKQLLANEVLASAAAFQENSVKLEREKESLSVD